jgi:murein DD-endopeptidase MepM/ murein hydrolase activator NlpD
LRRQGRVPSSQDIANAVAVVAQANNIADPNRIQVGQTLNLNAVISSTVPAGGPRLAQVSPSQELTRIVQSLVAKASVEKTAQTARMSVHNTGGGQGPWQRLVDAPVQVTSGYGFRKDPFGGGSEYHSGVDLAAAPGTAIHAWKSGIVKFSGWQPDYGRMVVVAHDDGTETAYAHNSTNLVKAGQQVDAHTRIALLGSTGRSTGPHLHFEVRRDGKPVDPEPLLQDGSLQIAKAL